MSDAAENLSKPKPRITWVDAAKGVSITFVVVYHLFLGLDSRVSGVPAFWDDVLNPVLTLVRMPLFFFVSGMFIARSVRKDAGTFIVDKLAVVVYPYLLWQTLQFSIAKLGGAKEIVGVSGEATWSKLPMLLAGYPKPYGQFWFLYVLFMAMMAYLAMSKLRFPTWLIAILGVLFFYEGHVLLEWLRLTEWGPAYQLRTFFVYMALGAIAAPFILPNAHRLPTWTLALIVVACGAGVSWSVLHEHLTRDGRWGPFIALSGVASLLALVVLMDRFKLAGVFRWIGSQSLPIFVAHVIAAAVTRTVLLKAGVTTFWPHLAAGLIAGIGGPIVLALVVQKLRIPFVFTAKWPRKSAANAD
jgi:uncharacterized membrane protein YcfT